MRFENHNAFPHCRNRQEQVACVGEAMRRLGEGCTADDLKNSLGMTQAELESVADDARAYAARLSVTQTRAAVPANRTAA